MSAIPCPECGTMVPAGRKLCQSCLYPIYMASLPDEERDDVSEDDIELPTGQQPAVEVTEIRPARGEGERATDPIGGPPAPPSRPRSVALIVLLTVGVTALVIIAVAFAITLTRDGSGETNPFSGRWVSIGNDGSRQEIVFTGSGDRRHARKEDESSARCGRVPSVSTGPGRLLDARRLSVTFSVACSNGRRVPQRAALFAYDPRAGTLEESTGVVWTRARD